MKEASRYGPHGYLRTPIDKTCCRASVPDGGRMATFHQCQRKAVVDGEWCRQHRPGAQEEREAKAMKAYEDARKSRARRVVNEGLARATVAQLRAELRLRTQRSKKGRGD